jgi:HSP20 family protein
MLKPMTTSRTALQANDPFQALFSHLFGESQPEPAGNHLAPRANISETEHAYELSFELPGHEEKDVHVHLHDHVLTVSAERKQDTETQGKRWHRREQRYGQYSRTIQLPQDAANQGIEAVYRQGLLLVTVPKAPESRPTKIEVRTA